MVGKLSVGDQICQNQLRFRNFSDYEAYIISIDEGYEEEYIFLTGIIIKSILLNLT